MNVYIIHRYVIHSLVIDRYVIHECRIPRRPLWGCRKHIRKRCKREPWRTPRSKAIVNSLKNRPLPPAKTSPNHPKSIQKRCKINPWMGFCGWARQRPPGARPGGLLEDPLEATLRVPQAYKTIWKPFSLRSFFWYFLMCILNRFLVPTWPSKSTKINGKSTPKGIPSWTPSWNLFLNDFCSQLGPSELKKSLKFNRFCYIF